MLAASYKNHERENNKQSKNQSSAKTKRDICGNGSSWVIPNCHESTNRFATAK